MLFELVLKDCLCGPAQVSRQQGCLGPVLVSVVMYLESKGPGVVGNVPLLGFFDVSLGLGVDLLLGGNVVEILMSS